MTIWVHLDHPRYGIDVYDPDELSPDEEKAIRGQGYITLDELRKVTQENERLAKELDDARWDAQVHHGMADARLDIMIKQRRALIELIETMDSLELTAAVPADTRRLAYG